MPQLTSDASGAKWTSPTGTVQVLLTRRKEASPTTAKLAEQEKKEPAGRTIDYTVVKPDFFVLSGMQGLKKFYLRGTLKGDEVRILTILYDQATQTTVEPVVIAMSSAFNAFPSTVQAGPPPRKTVEYSTGVVVSDDGTIVADRVATGDCLALTIPGYGNADRVAEDKDHRARIAADLRRARAEAAQHRGPGDADRARHHRHRRSAEPGRRRRGEQRSRLRWRNSAAAMPRCRRHLRSGSPAPRRRTVAASSPASHC